MYEFLSYCVEDAMSREPATIQAEATLGDAQALFEKHGFNGLPVVDSDGRLVGLLTQLDVLRAFRFTTDSVFPAYERVMEQPVRECMQTETRAVRPLTPLTRVLEQLVTSRYKSFIVADRDRPIGMVSREDVLRALRRATAGERAPGLAQLE